MKALRVFALAISVFLVGDVEAQDQYDVGMFFDSAGTVSDAFASPGVNFDLHAVAFGLDGDVKAFELGINGLLETGAFLVGNVMAGPAPLNIQDSGTLSYLVGTGGCISGEPSIALVTLTVLQLTAFASDTAVCIGGIVPSSFEGPPGYANCNDQIVPFGIAPSGGGAFAAGCAIINPSSPTDPGETVSFSDIKARY